MIGRRARRVQALALEQDLEVDEGLFLVLVEVAKVAMRVADTGKARGGHPPVMLRAHDDTRVASGLHCYKSCG